MKTKEIQFDGKKYICRIVESIDGEELLIGSTELLDEALYDEVFYFTEPENLLLPDEELIEVLKESNPDWFE